MNDWPKEQEAREAFQLIAMQIVPSKTSVQRVKDLAFGLFQEYMKFKESEE